MDTAAQAPSKRRLARACKHVGDLWFPASPALLKEIKGKLFGGVYDHDPALFYDDVRSDFSLFMYMLRKLASLVKYEDGIEQVAAPLELFTRVGIVRLKEVIDFEDPVFSRHPLQQVSTSQSARLEEAFVSASAVESIAAPLGYNAEGGYAMALFRQLGLTLVAFNYPTVYEETISKLDVSDDLESKLATRLGFTPSLLAISLFREWGVEPHFFDSMPERLSLDSKERAIGMTLSRICEVGEALARANNPALYPTASRDWSEARQVIDKTLGAQGLSVIRATLKKNLLAFAKATPGVFKAGISLNPETKIWKVWDDKHRAVNPFLLQCKKEFQRPLHNFYDRVIQNKVPQDAVGVLVKEIFPVAGFKGGCVYTVDPVTRMFYPQLRVNEVRLRLLEPIPYGNTDDPVAEAFAAQAPVIGVDEDSRGTNVTYLACVLGQSQRVGVLYVEMDEADYQLNGADYSAHVQALSKALGDALRLR